MNIISPKPALAVALAFALAAMPALAQQSTQSSSQQGQSSAQSNQTSTTPGETSAQERPSQTTGQATGQSTRRVDTRADTDSSSPAMSEWTRQQQFGQRQGRGQQGREISGEIIGIKRVGFRGTQESNQVALVRTQDNQRIVVDLGPESDLRSLDLNVGDQIVAHGRMDSMGDRDVLMARQIRADGQVYSIDRQAQRDRMMQTRGGQGPAGARGREAQFTGDVIGEKTVDVRGTNIKHQVVLIKTDDNRRVVADLGDTSELEGQNVQVSVGDQVELRARPTRIGDRLVFMANWLKSGDRQINIDSAGQFTQARDQSMRSRHRETVAASQQRQQAQQQTQTQQDTQRYQQPRSQAQQEQDTQRYQQPHSQSQQDEQSYQQPQPSSQQGTQPSQQPQPQQGAQPSGATQESQQQGDAGQQAQR